MIIWGRLSQLPGWRVCHDMIMICERATIIRKIFEISLISVFKEFFAGIKKIFIKALFIILWS